MQKVTIRRKAECLFAAHHFSKHYKPILDASKLVLQYSGLPNKYDKADAIAINVFNNLTPLPLLGRQRVWGRALWEAITGSKQLSSRTIVSYEKYANDVKTLLESEYLLTNIKQTCEKFMYEFNNVNLDVYNSYYENEAVKRAAFGELWLKHEPRMMLAYWAYYVRCGRPFDLVTQINDNLKNEDDIKLFYFNCHKFVNKRKKTVSFESYMNFIGGGYEF